MFRPFKRNGARTGCYIKCRFYHYKLLTDASTLFCIFSLIFQYIMPLSKECIHNGCNLFCLDWLYTGTLHWLKLHVIFDQGIDALRWDHLSQTSIRINYIT